MPAIELLSLHISTIPLKFQITKPKLQINPNNQIQNSKPGFQNQNKIKMRSKINFSAGYIIQDLLAWEYESYALGHHYFAKDGKISGKIIGHPAQHPRYSPLRASGNRGASEIPPSTL
jgi:hypothetical protein